MKTYLKNNNSEMSLLKNNYNEIKIKYDASLKALYVYMCGKPRPSFTMPQLLEYKHLTNAIKDYTSDKNPIHYLILASDYENIYSMGGDLSLFCDCVDRQDSESLREYAYLCTEMVYDNMLNFDKDIITISLIQGTAYGGGFEAALSCNIIISEKGIKLGFPEILFNLFPGMGSYTFLSFRVEPIFVDEIINDSKIYLSDELYEKGVIDVLTESGDGESALYNYINTLDSKRKGYIAKHKARLQTFPLSLKEMKSICDIWVESALKISQRDLKLMGRMVKRQGKLVV